MTMRHFCLIAFIGAILICEALSFRSSPAFALEDVPDSEIGVISVRLWVHQGDSWVNLLDTQVEGFPSILNGSLVRFEATLRNYSPEDLQITKLEAGVYINETYAVQTFSREPTSDRSSCPARHIITEDTDPQTLTVNELTTYRLYIYFTYDKISVSESGTAAYYRNISISVTLPPSPPPDILLILIAADTIGIVVILFIGLYGRFWGRREEIESASD